MTAALAKQEQVLLLLNRRGWAAFVQCTIDVISTQSAALRALLEDGSIAIAGSMYDVGTGRVHFTA